MPDNAATATLQVPSFPGAPCRDKGALFFSAPHSRDHRAALAICEPCPHRAACLEFAINNPTEGVWGATTERQRRALSRRRGVSEPQHAQLHSAATAGISGSVGGGPDRQGKAERPTSTLLTCATCGGTGLDPVRHVSSEEGGYTFITGCPTCGGVEPGPPLHHRIKLALSLLQHRVASEQTNDLVIRVLHGATLEELIALEASA